MTVRSLHRTWPAVLLLLAGLGLAACSSEQRYGEPYDAARSHPFDVESRRVAHAIVVDRHAARFDADTAADLDRYVDEFIRVGGGVMELTVHGDPSADIAMRSAVAGLEAQLLKRGVRPHEIVVATVAEAGADDGTIVLSYDRFRARRIPCGNQPTGGSFNPRNQSHPDFGCSLQANMAAMVANPADLVRPRQLQAADAMRRSFVVERYRTGETTGRERGEGEQAKSIEQLIK